MSTEQIDTVWHVRLSKKSAKQYAQLRLSGRKRLSIIDIIDLLMRDLKQRGPERADWPNYSKLAHKMYHCHLQKKDRPTYVACWKVFSEEYKQIEVYYVGTRENAPY